MATYTAKALQLPIGGSNKLVELKDAVAREALVGGTHYRGVTTTELTDGASTNPIVIDSKSYDAVNGDMVIYGNKEFLFSSVDNKWHEYQDLSGLGALAYEDAAVGEFTPAGQLSGFGVTLSSTTGYVAASEDGGGEVDSDTGTADELTMEVPANTETLSIGWTAGIPLNVTLPTFEEQTIVTGVSAVTQPAFSGTAGTIEVAPAT